MISMCVSYIYYVIQNILCLIEINKINPNIKYEKGLFHHSQASQQQFNRFNGKDVETYHLKNIFIYF